MTEDRLQSFAEPWWVECDPASLQRGQLVQAFLPHVDIIPLTLVAVARQEATDHTRIRYRLEDLRINAPRERPTLPVAALPHRRGECFTVHRAKQRPSLVICVGGSEVPERLRPDSTPAWQSAPTFLVAPYYGGPPTNAREGWHPPFLARIKACEYPQFMLDQVPGSGFDSVLRLDHIQPVGRHKDSYIPLGYRLSADALGLLDEWLVWFQTGDLDASTMLHDIRTHLMVGSSIQADAPVV